MELGTANFLLQRSFVALGQLQCTNMFFQLPDNDTDPSSGNLHVVKRLARETTTTCLTFTSVSCKRIVADFRFLDEFERNIAEPYKSNKHNEDKNERDPGNVDEDNTGSSNKDKIFSGLKSNQRNARAGTLLKMLLTQLDYSDWQANQASRLLLLSCIADNVTRLDDFVKLLVTKIL